MSLRVITQEERFLAHPVDRTNTGAARPRNRHFAPLVTVLVAALALVASAFGQGGDQVRTLVVAGEAVGENFMPAAGTQGWAHTWVLSNVYEGLYTSRDQKTLEPSLALNHEVSEDGLTYTFTLRENVVFHDGTPFNAGAVEFNYMRYIDRDHPYYESNAPWHTAFLGGVTNVQAVDEYTVQFTLEAPRAALPASLSTYYSGIVSPTAIEAHGVADIGRFPVGTGPYRFEQAQRGNQATLVAFPDYWGGRPGVERVVIRVVPDDQAMLASLLAGEVDLTPFVDLKDLPVLRRQPQFNVVVVPATATGYLAMNAANPAVADVRIRRAIAHAINEQEIIDVIFEGEADPAAGLISLPMWGYASELEDYYPYDPTQARELLSDVGATPALTLNVQSSGFWPRMAELIQAQLAAVGLDVSIEQVDPAAFYGRMTEGAHHMFLGDAAAQTPDPEDLFWTLFGCENPRSKRWGHCDESFDSLVAEQSAMSEQSERREVLVDLQRMLLDEAVQIPLYYSRFAYIVNSQLEGFTPLPVRFIYLDDAYWQE